MISKSWPSAALGCRHKSEVAAPKWSRVASWTSPHEKKGRELRAYNGPGDLI